MSLKLIDERNVLDVNFRIYGTFEEPLFLAKEVAEWIGYDTSSINKMLDNVDDEEKLVGTIFRSGQNREMWCLTEEGLYEVLMLSRKPNAKIFKKEVKKILKTIRKTGGYNVSPPTRALPQTYKEALIELVQQLEINEQQYLALEEAKPKVEFYDAVTDSKDAISISEVAKVLDMGIGRNKMFEYLREKGFLRHNNEPYQKYIDNGCFRVIEQKYQKNGDTCINLKTLVFQKGLDEIRKSIIQDRTDKPQMLGLFSEIQE